MTTIFQQIINRAETLTIDTKKSVAQTIARDGTVRTVSQSAMPWRFTVTVADGRYWTDERGMISELEAAGQHTVGTIQISAAGHDYISKYLGEVPSPNLMTAEVTGATEITPVGTVWPFSTGYLFRRGDLVQIGTSGRVYRVIEDVYYDSSLPMPVVKLHRPVVEATGVSHSLRVGQSVTWEVVCTQMPSWNLFRHNMVAWSGPFEFVEDLT